MPTPSRKTPQLIERMLAMQADGSSAREIGKALGLTHKTVTRYLDDVGQVPNGGAGPRARRPRKKLTREEAPAAVAGQTLAMLGKVPPVGPGLTPLEHAQARLDEATVIGNAIRQQFIEGKRTARDYLDWQKREQELRTELAGLMPLAPVAAGEEDDVVLDGAQSARDKLALLVAAAKETFRCASCGRSPYGRKDGGG